MFILLDSSSYILSYELRCIVLYFTLWPQMITPVLSSSHCPTIPAATSTMPATSMWVWLVISDNRQLDSVFDEWPDMERSIEGLFVCLCACHLVFYSLNTPRVSVYYFDCFFCERACKKIVFLVQGYAREKEYIAAQGKNNSSSWSISALSYLLFLRWVRLLYHSNILQTFLAIAFITYLCWENS